MRLGITIDGTQTEVPIKPADLIRFERHYRITWEESQKKVQIEYIFFLAWTAAVRLGLTTDAMKAQETDAAGAPVLNPDGSPKLVDSFDTWMDQVDDLDEIEEPPLQEQNATSSQ